MKVKLNSRVHPDCPNFKWYEVWKSNTADRLEIDNVSTDPEVQYNARQFTLHILQPLRDTFGSFKLSSWYRGEELERVITQKGFKRWCKVRNLKPNSKSWKKYFKRKSHPTGGCGDIEIIGLDNEELFNYIHKNMEFDQLIREYAVQGEPTSGWVHVSWAGNQNRNQVLRRP